MNNIETKKDVEKEFFSLYRAVTIYIRPLKRNSYLGIKGHNEILVMKKGKLRDTEIAKKWWETFIEEQWIKRKGRSRKY